MRDRLYLDGEWDFLHASNDSALEPVEQRRVRVPGAWQSQFPDLRMKAGIGAYRRSFVITRQMRKERLYLTFGAVFHHSKVWVNGSPVGAHQGGFLPFSFDITDYVIEGDNEVLVRVEAPTDNSQAYPEAPFAEIPFGKQSWYGPLSGIWQSVYIEARSADFIERARICAELDKHNVDVTVFLRDPLSRSAKVRVEIREPLGALVAEEDAACRSGVEEVHCAFCLAHVLPWSPDEPNVYSAVLTIERDGRMIDRIVQTFGFRTFETRDGKFYLNGQPFYMRGALDQDYYPDTICTPPSEAFLEDQFRKAKELGLNCLRIHIKAPDPRYYDVADRIGMLVWAELPNGGLSTERSRARKERLLKGMVDRDSHHPSIVIWTIINENWGVDLVHDSAHRDWLRRTFHWLKAYDPTRLVVDNSPLSPSFHVETDIADYHFYAAIPDSRMDWDRFVDELASRPDWLFSPEGDAAPTGKEPLVCSEFGNWGLPFPPDLADASGHEPWWFETGHDWGDGVMYPHGIEYRFNDWSLNRVFGSLRAFVEECQWQQFRALQYEIAAMRRRREIAGYVITELTDVHWESNGLLDMRRNTRVFHDRFAAINSDIVILPRLSKNNFWDDEPVGLDIAIANGGGATGPLDLHVDGPVSTTINLGSVGEGALRQAPPLTFKTGGKKAIELERIGLRLMQDRREIARADVDLSLAPCIVRQPDRVRIWSPEEDARTYLERLGYEVVTSPAQAQLAVATRPSAGLERHVREGGRLLLVSEGAFELQPLFPHWQNVRLVPRAGTHWRGDWASSFSWLRRAGPFADLPGPKLMDMRFERVIPDHVIAGCNLLDFQARVYAGIVVGWIHKAAAITVERTYGKGHFALTSFRLFRDPPGADPMATLLLARHVALALQSWEKPAAPQAPAKVWR